MFIVKIQTLKGRASSQIQFKTAIRFLRAGPAALIRFFQTKSPGHFRCVKLALACGEYGYRNGRQPPVYQIEVVCCFVHHQTAGIFFLTVPTAEVIRAMVGIQHPMEIHG